MRTVRCSGRYAWAGGSDCGGVSPRQTDRHLWKHNLSAIADGNKCFHSPVWDHHMTILWKLFMVRNFEIRLTSRHLLLSVRSWSEVGLNCIVSTLIPGMVCSHRYYIGYCIHLYVQQIDWNWPNGNSVVHMKIINIYLFRPNYNFVDQKSAVLPFDWLHSNGNANGTWAIQNENLSFVIPLQLVKDCLHLTKFSLLFFPSKNGLHGNKWWCSHLTNFRPNIGLIGLCTHF